VLLKHHLKALKLPTMTAECEKVAGRCAKENADHLSFLLQLCELELLDRERRAAALRLKAAKFPTLKGLDSFDFATAPSVNKPMILELMRCEYVDRLTRLKSQLAKLDLLVLDELGYVPASKVGAELLFDVINTAYERSSVIVTTNLPFEEWKEVLGSERLTGATLDRLTHRCTTIETGRESYRLRDARRRRRGPAASPAEPTIDAGAGE
jgi:DNA replication protein DnaC